MESLPSKILVREMTVYFGIFKEPRGLIRLLQFIFAIFAFATACNGGSDLIIGDAVVKDHVSASWSYPYNLQDTPINTKLAKTQDKLSKSNSIKPSAEFFVFTGVTSMLLSLVFLVIYVLSDRQYRNDERFPMIDFVLTLIWTIFWIAGSSAWGQGVSDLRSQTDIDYITGLVSGCKNGTTVNFCSDYESGTYANVTVSVIFGFLNFLLWAASVWFIYKETRFFKSHNAQQQQPPLPNNFSNITPPVPGTMT